MCSLFWEANDDKITMIAMGDTNTCVGDLRKICNGYHYNKNPDPTVNENGRYLCEMLLNSTSATPIIHMINVNMMVILLSIAMENNQKLTGVLETNTFYLMD